MLRAYAQAWSEVEEGAVRARLEGCWAADSTYANPFVERVRGLDGLTALILDYPLMFPDATVRPQGDSWRRQDCACWPWRLTSRCRIRILGRDYGYTLDGVDAIIFNDAGRLSDVVGLFCVGAGPATARRLDDHARSWQVNAKGPRPAGH